jgi:hypothetical protein
MIRLFALVAILCGVLFALGGTTAPKRDRLRLRVLTEPRLITVIVTLPDVSDRYRWLSVYACSAAFPSDSPSAYCTGDFERESSFELSGGATQHLVHWRDMPRGTIQVQAMAFDAEQQILASGVLTVFRGQ